MKRASKVGCSAGAAGFGIGSALYRPGIQPPELRDRAHKLVSALRALAPTQLGAGSRGA